MHTISTKGKRLWFSALSASVLLLILLTAASVTVVPSGCSGVVTECGAVSGRVLGEGIHWKLPFVQGVVQMDNHILKVELPFITPCSDNRTVSGTVSVSYRIKPERSASVYQNFGKSVETILIQPSIPACTRAISGRYAAVELLSRLELVSEKIKLAIDRKVQPYGLKIEALYITDLQLIDEPQSSQTQQTGLAQKL